jgi:transposase
MIALSAQVKVFIATKPVDFRKGILGLKSICRETLKQSPESGTFFLFRNRGRSAIKILAYDGQGFWLMLKRLSQGKFPWWPSEHEIGSAINYRQLHLIINASEEIKFSQDWKKII